MQPQAFGAFCTVSWAQCLYYGKGYSKLKATLCLLAFYCVFAGFETGSVFALWAGERNGVTWPQQMYGWITSALLIIGLLPQYYEIYKAKEVVGISITFMLVDIFGGLFSGVVRIESLPELIGRVLCSVLTILSRFSSARNLTRLLSCNIFLSSCLTALWWS